MTDNPQYLYKVLALNDWAASQPKTSVQLSSDDDAFIHFSTEEQLQRIITKYWADVPELIVLKIDTSKLEGDLVFEANPGGINKYYHLYNGCIPLAAVTESKTVKNSP